MKQPVELAAPLVAGMVDRTRDHMILSAEVDGEMRVIALVAPASRGRFTVQIVLPADAPGAADAIRDAVRELRYYLVELGERDPWAYANYHAGTSANVYSTIRWGRFPFGAKPDGSPILEPPDAS